LRAATSSPPAAAPHEAPPVPHAAGLSDIHGRTEKESSMTKQKSRVRSIASVLCAGASILVGSQQFCAAQSSDPVLEQRHPRYILQREDVLLVSFPLSTELNQTVTIQPDGYITLLNAGSIYAQGLTVPELVEGVKKAYTGILHDPVVNVDVQDFQKPFFTVSGQVGKPGQYELRSDITVAEAIAVAGGMTMQTAKTQIFLFHRTSKDWVEVKKVNLKDVLKGKNVNEDAMVLPGDMIYVPEKFIANFRKYVPYSIGAMSGTYLQP
jgi:polysaccharide export outer membrane protein